MRKVFASLVYAFVALPVLLGALFLAGASPRLLDRDTWMDALGDDRLWTAARTFEPTEEGLEAAVAELPSGVRIDPRLLWNAARSELPWDDLKVQTLNSFSDFWDEARGSGNDDMVRIEPFRLILENRADDIATAYAAGLEPAPPGTASDPMDLTVIPAGTDAKDAARVLEAALREGISRIPDSVPVETAGSPAARLSAARQGLGTASRASIFAGAALWIGLAFAAYGSWSRRVRWLGTTLAIPGGIVLGTGLLIRLPLEAALTGALRSPELAAMLSGPAAQDLAAWVRGLASLVSNGFIVSGGVASVIAAIALGASRPIEAAERGEDE
ncbi:MAG: hypothetical protein JXA15_08660 [Spirochaetales bacterium]|nr:hypothetical protein [Spirochaetales bacterium]